MKNLPIGIQSFSKLRKGEFLYIDKTEDIYNLFSNGGRYYFLSRPRRFGKSLLISTLSELAAGNKELFKGLWIYDKIEWKKHPVVHIDFSGMQYGSEKKLQETLNYLIDKNAEKYQVRLKENDYDKKFVELITELSQQAPVTVLVDEYDKPIIDMVEKKEIAEANRKILGNFYSIIKAVDQHLGFVFFTGVSKFSKVSVFSGLNNLRDITMSKQFPTLLGYTEKELQHYFDDYIKRLAGETEINRKSLIDKIRDWYNGYSWDGAHFVYNPFSILNLFAENTFGNFWFSTGTPSFLIKLIKQQKSNITEFDDLPVSSYAFDSYDIEHMEIVPLLFQTGYLTVKERFVKRDKTSYRLSYPNKEVRDSFLTYLFREYTKKDLPSGTLVLERMAEAVEADDIAGLIDILKSLFASIPYNIFIGEREAYYHTVIYLMLKLTGADIVSEVATNIGRIDAVLETEKKVYIMEFKTGSEQQALAQIKEKGYHEKFRNCGKEIVQIGIGFDMGKRNIGKFILETLYP